MAAAADTHARVHGEIIRDGMIDSAKVLGEALGNKVQFGLGGLGFCLIIAAFVGKF